MTHVLCVKTVKHFVEILFLPDSRIILVFRHRGLVAKLRRLHPKRGRQYKGVDKIARFLTNKSVYLGNAARYGHSCYRSRLGNHTRAIEWWHFDDLERPPFNVEALCLAT